LLAVQKMYLKRVSYIKDVLTTLACIGVLFWSVDQLLDK